MHTVRSQLRPLKDPCRCLCDGKDTYLEYMIEKVLQKLDLKQKESCKVFSINEVADMLKVSKRTVEGHLYDKRDLPYLKIGRKVRITKSDLESFLGLVS